VDPGIFVPLLLPVLSWPIARLAGSRLNPHLASWLLTVTALMLAIGSTVSLGLLAFAGLSLIPAVARFGEWSPQALSAPGVSVFPAGICGSLALGAIVVSALITGSLFAGWLRRVRREIREVGRHSGLIVLPHDEPFAVAMPLRGGRIVVSQGMLAVLNAGETRALLAHERAHLRHRHHMFLAAVGLSTVLNPLVFPLRSAVVFALERWADEVAAERLGDRRVVASAVAKAALASRRGSRFALAASGGPVPRRVSALLRAPAPRFDWRSVAGFCVVVSILAAGWSVEATIEAAADVRAGIENGSTESPDPAHVHHHVHHNSVP
jgi:Zn-dependent protease with chaperone function